MAITMRTVGIRLYLPWSPAVKSNTICGRAIGTWSTFQEEAASCPRTDACSSLAGEPDQHWNVDDESIQDAGLETLGLSSEEMGGTYISDFC